MARSVQRSSSHHNVPMKHAFEFDEFTKAFVAVLVEAERRSIQPKDPVQRRAFYQVWKILGNQVKQARGSATQDWLRTVVRIRNRMSPGQTGAFDQFETALRDLQLSLTESPNPSYEDISFTVSKPFAKSLLNKLAPQELQLVRRAADVFLQSTGRADVAQAS